jgi:sRNA-binding regulator protein Hfq
MGLESTQPRAGTPAAASSARLRARSHNQLLPVAAFRLAANGYGTAQDQEPPQRQAEVFYLQKQIQAQTPMVLIMEDGEQIEGCIEWYDRNVLKLRGKQKTLVYKDAIKYMYKLGDAGKTRD